MLILRFPEIYDLSHTFDCGQTFRFQSFGDSTTYYGPLSDRIVKIHQKDGHTLEIESTKSEGLEPLIARFLRTQDNYLQIQQALKIDPLMIQILETTNGLHLLQQDKFECTIAYFLSQCSNIPRIKQSLHAICTRWGHPVTMDGHDFYLFPTYSELAGTSEETFRAMKFGYRAKYISHFLEHYPSFYDDPKPDFTILNKSLMKIEGIGPKVADCIQLFVFGDVSLFPVDTWMEKFILKHYANGQKLTLKQIRALGQQLFGQYAGYAQEFIFHYARCYDPLL